MISEKKMNDQVEVAANDVNVSLRNNVDVLVSIFKILYGMSNDSNETTLAIKKENTNNSIFVKRRRKFQKTSKIGKDAFATNMTFFETKRTDLNETLMRDYGDVINDFNMEVDKFIAYCIEIYENQDSIKDFHELTGIENLQKKSAENSNNNNDNIEDKPKEFNTSRSVEPFEGKVEEDEQSSISKSRLDSMKLKRMKAAAVYINESKNRNLIPQMYLKDLLRSDKKREAFKEYMNAKHDAINVMEEIHGNESTAVEQENFQSREKPKTKSIDEQKNHSESETEGHKRLYKNLRKLSEIVIIVIYLVMTHSFLSIKSIDELSLFRMKIEYVFSEVDFCIDKWKVIKSPKDVNDWFSGCLYQSVKNYMWSSLTAVVIRRVDIQILDKNLTDCRQFNVLNISFIETPKCFSEDDVHPLGEKKSAILKQYKLNYTDNYYNVPLGLIDSFFYSDRRIINATMIMLSTSEDLENFKKTVDIKKNLLDIQSLNGTLHFQWKLYDLMNKLTTSTKTDAYSELRKTLVDITTRKMQIDVIFSNQGDDANVFGVQSFFYEAVGSSVVSDVGNIIFEKEQTSPIGNIFLILISAVLLLLFYFKVIALQSVSAALNRSFFCVLFFILFAMENIVTVYHFIIGSADFTNDVNLLQDDDVFDRFIVLNANVRMIKSFQIIFLMYHTLYVLFEPETISAFTIFLKPVFQRMSVVTLLLTCAFSVFFTIYGGTHYKENGSFLQSLGNLLQGYLGIIYIGTTDDSTYTFNVRLLKSFLTIINYFFKVFFINISLVFMFYYYKKSYTQYFDTPVSWEQQEDQKKKSKKKGKKRRKKKKVQDITRMAEL